MQMNIKYVNEPSSTGSGKYGSIVDYNGTKVWVPVDMLPMFQQGMSCEIATKTQTWGRGTDREAEVLIAASGPGGAPTGGVGQQPYSRQQQWAGPRPPAQRPPQAFQPRVVQGGLGSQAGMPAGTDQARQIFVTGVVGRAMGSGKFAASEIPVLTDAANEAYDRLEHRRRPAPEPPPTVTNYGEPPTYEPGDPGPELQ